jgi:hypothetical protein
MPITPEIDNWLIISGYEYHCFISWAHTKNRDMTECAKIMKQEIEQKLALSIPNPRVFLDESEIFGGADWEQQLLRALCRSVSMVSLCAPIYYHPTHRWCGVEWAAMSALGQSRLPKEEFKTIIPLLLKRGETPNAVATIQHIDFSSVILRGRNYYRTNDFKNKVQQIIDRIEMIAQAIATNQSMTNCGDFKLPMESAFSDYQVKALGLPLRADSA